MSEDRATDLGEPEDASFQVVETLAERKLKRIEQLEAEVKESEQRWQSLKEDASQAKKVYEGRVATLRQAIRQKEEPTLFDNQQGEDAEDRWRAVPIREALEGLAEKVYEGFDAVGIRTMGDYQEYMYDHIRTDLEGVGEKGAEKLEQAETAFWERWSREQSEAEQCDLEEGPSTTPGG